MKSVLLVLALLMCGTAQAGVLRTLSFPFRHPVKVLKVPAKAIIFPIVHPKRFWVKWDTTPQCNPCPDRAHGPSLPPDPWSDAKFNGVRCPAGEPGPLGPLSGDTL